MIFSLVKSVWDLSKNICVNFKLYCIVHINEYTKLVYLKTFLCLLIISEVSLPFLYYIGLNLTCQFLLYYANSNKNFLNGSKTSYCWSIADLDLLMKLLKTREEFYAHIINEFRTNNLKVIENMNMGLRNIRLLSIIFVLVAAKLIKISWIS